MAQFFVYYDIDYLLKTDPIQLIVFYPVFTKKIRRCEIFIYGN